MAPNVDFVTVNVSVNGKTQTIKMERGTSFENKGGIFTAGETNGVLKMTNYQLQAFKAMANNYTEEGEDGIVLSKEDIRLAQQNYRNGEFVADMSEFLPEGYKIERPKLTSAENKVQAYVTNGNESTSATLKFSFKNLFKTEQKPLNVTNDVPSSRVTNNETYNIKDVPTLYDEKTFEPDNYIGGKYRVVKNSNDGTTTYFYNAFPDDYPLENSPKDVTYENYVKVDSKGHVIEQKIHIDGGGEHRFYNGYELRKGINKRELYQDNKLVNCLVKTENEGTFYYDSNGNMRSKQIGNAIFTPDGKPIYKSEYIYESMRYKTTIYNEDGSVLFKEVYPQMFDANSSGCAEYSPLNIYNGGGRSDEVLFDEDFWAYDNLTWF